MRVLNQLQGSLYSYRGVVYNVRASSQSPCGRIRNLDRRYTHQGTHVVFNQARPFVDIDQVLSDRVLSRVMDRLALGEEKQIKVQQFGRLCGSAKFMALADDAEANRPTLRQFDHYGNRIDVIDYHASYHELMSHTIESGCTVYGHNDAMNPAAHITRAALLLQSNQLEPGHCCPVTMTAAAVPVLRDPHAHPYVKQFLDKVLTGKYDPADAPISSKEGATIGMSMTEKQGGSDVRANTTIATRVDGGGAYSLRGHKWFTSAGMSDGFLTLAKVDSQDALPSCFLVPRWLPDGARNAGFHLVRMKRKMADLANASSEVEYHDCYGYPVGEEGKGVKTILQMVQLTRLDCCIGATGGMRRALQVAINHTNTRCAFGTPLIKQPLMEQLLAELCVEAEAHTLSTMRMAQAYGNGDEEAELFRVGVAIMKYYSTKAVPHFTYECLETLGGNGFTEDFPAAKLFRHSPLNSIWEGSGNVMALDVLRASKALPSFLAQIAKSKGADSALDAFVAELTKSLRRLPSLTPHEQQASARNLCDRLALAFQASLLVDMGGLSESAKLFIGSRIAGQAVGGPRNYGTSGLASSHEAQTIIQDSIPVFSSR